jgi:hypothetical protein
MDLAEQKREIEEKLARCRQLLADYPNGQTARNLRELEIDLQGQLFALDRHEK